MTTGISAIESGATSGTTSNFKQKGNEELNKIQEMQESNPFSKFDSDGDGKIAGTELAAMKLVLTGISFNVDSDGSIDESAFNSAFKNAEFEAQ